MRRLIAAVIVAMTLASTASAQTIPAPSDWKNQRGSVLRITSVDGSGVIKGNFTNNAAGFQCQGTPFDIVGHTLKTGLFFGVTFGPCNSIVSWRGTVAGNTITTSWALSVIDTESGAIETISGIDTFTQSP